MVNGLRVAVIGLLALVCSVAIAEPVAMVTDIVGSAQMDGQDVELLTEMMPGSQIDVAEGANIVVVYFENGAEFSYTGPAKFEVGAAAPKTLTGSEPASESLVPEGSGSVSPVGLAQAAMVMRAMPNETRLQLIAPVNTTLIAPPQQFEWVELAEGIGYTFELTDAEGESLLESTVTGHRLAIPEHVELEPGAFYSWSLETRLPDGRKFSSWADFGLAEQALAQQAQQRHPGDDASVSELVFYAIWLEQQDLLNEADEVWKQIEALRPEQKDRSRRRTG